MKKVFLLIMVIGLILMVIGALVEEPEAPSNVEQAQIEQVQQVEDAQQPEEIEKINRADIQVMHLIDDDGLLSFKITAPIKGDVELSISLSDSDNNSLGGSKGVMHDGVFLSEKFSKGGKPHVAGQYSLFVIEANKPPIYEGERIFEPFDYEFELLSSSSTPEPLTTEEKQNILKTFTSILNDIDNKREELQSQSNISGTYIANWNRNTQQWVTDTETKYQDILGSGLNAPFCSSAAFSVRLSLTNIKLLGIGYVSGDYKIQESNLKEDFASARSAIAECQGEL